MILPKQKGDSALGKAISHYLSSGFEVLLPIGDKRDYDLVIEKDGTLSRVQVKYGGLYNGRTTCKVALRIMGGNQSYFSVKRYTASSFDYLFVHTAKGESYILPWQGEIVGQTTLNIEAAKYAAFKVPMQG